ncbi:MAG: hypothetical protein K2L68_00310 [Muribaculaceae bacterium]|nr:hypothetical protein [Muribaculaceae bacterium]
MKKLFLSIIAIAASCLAGNAQTTLADAYNSLSALSGMSEQSVGKIAVGQGNAISNAKTASVNVADGKVQEYRDKFVWMTENLPVRNMIIGANNQREMAAVYAVPAGGGKYNVLVLQGNTLSGNFSASYGQTKAAGIKAIRDSQVTMDSTELVVTPTSNSGNDSFVSMTD